MLVVRLRCPRQDKDEHETTAAATSRTPTIRDAFL
jgi:hypothetical protein